MKLSLNTHFFFNLSGMREVNAFARLRLCMRGNTTLMETALMRRTFFFTLILTLAFIKTDSGPPAAGYHDASSILIVREETMYNKYLKQ